MEETTIKLDKPQFINDDGCNWELYGPIFSVTCIKEDGRYSIYRNTDNGADLLKYRCTDEEEIAKNLCVVYYNLTIQALTEAKAENED